jgi:hypothetical protein
MMRRHGMGAARAGPPGAPLHRREACGRGLHVHAGRGARPGGLGKFVHCVQQGALLPPSLVSPKPRDVQSAGPREGGLLRGLAEQRSNCESMQMERRHANTRGCPPCARLVACTSGMGGLLKQQQRGQTAASTAAGVRVRRGGVADKEQQGKAARNSQSKNCAKL